MSQEDIRIVQKMRTITSKDKNAWRDMTPKPGDTETEIVKPVIPSIPRINNIIPLPPNENKYNVFIHKKTKEQMILIQDNPETSVVLIAHYVEISKKNMTLTYATDRTSFFANFSKKL